MKSNVVGTGRSLQALSGAGNSVDSIVTAVEQISTRVAQVSCQVQESSKMIRDAVAKTGCAERNAQHLEKAAGDIGQVISLIDGVNEQINLLALNATIEAARAGQAGKGFTVVANEVKGLASQASKATQTIRQKIQSVQSITSETLKTFNSLMGVVQRIDQGGESIVEMTNEQNTVLEHISKESRLISQQFEARDANRLTDLARTLVQLIVRNLYERTADVRWWATESAFVDFLTSSRKRPLGRLRLASLLGNSNLDALRAVVTERLSTINRFYSVYLNLVLLDRNGRVVACSRGETYPLMNQADLSTESWFCKAIDSASGDEYFTSEIYRDPLHADRNVAVYAAAVRSGGQREGTPVGVLAVYFDWEEQARVIVRDEPTLDREEWSRSRVLLLDQNHRVIAASDGQGLFEVFPLNLDSGNKGYYTDANGATVAYSKTIGYQEYDGQGWYGVIVQRSKSSS